MASKRFLKAWVKALRSGKYKQAKGALRVAHESAFSAKGYCCLGVACAVQARLTHKSVRNFTKGKGPMLVEAYAGAWLFPEADQFLFTRMNDHERLTFKQIADIIEAKYINT